MESNNKTNYLPYIIIYSNLIIMMIYYIYLNN